MRALKHCVYKVYRFTINNLIKMKKFLLLSLLTIIFGSVYAQQNLPPAYIIKTDTAVKPMLDSTQWKMLEDTSGSHTIEQVSSLPLASKFHTDTAITAGIDYHINTFWFCYHFKNTMNRDAEITILEGGLGEVLKAEIYTRNDKGVWVMKQSGDALPWSKRDDLKEINGVDFVVGPGAELVIYEKKVVDYWLYKPKKLSPGFGFTEKVVDNTLANEEKSESIRTFTIFLLGIFLLAAFSNILFFGIVKEPVYLFFSIFVFSFGVFECSDILSNLLFKEYRLSSYYLTDLMRILWFFFLPQFLRYFFDIKQTHPEWDKKLLIFSYLQAGCWVCLLLIPASLPYHLFDILTTALNLVAFIYMPCVLLPLLFFINIRDWGTTLKGVSALPAIIIWGLLYPYREVYFLLNKHFQTPLSSLAIWTTDHQKVVELVGMGWVILLFSWLLFHRFYNLQKHVVVDLRAAQNRLIQSEKMASMGELTAGIAHEIQNPLNFVNNFSELSVELTAELKEEIRNGNTDDAIAIADDLGQNLEKILHHGKRADFIVKGMLQHSRTSTGERQPTNINIIAGEFLRLSYHGLRSKDKLFNSEMVTSFDKDLPAINAVQQDIGRVMLNLFNNAFYSVNQKQKTAGANYKPEVTVTTNVKKGNIFIKVKDNGVGIPDHIKSKIMQPFFTTKPTGEGTGLGLSLTYDIVVKGHGGSMTVDSKEGEFAEFTVVLPIR